MCTWLEDTCKATNTDRVFMADFEHGDVHVRGLGVSTDVRKDEFVFCVPKACWLSKDVIPPTFGAEDRTCPSDARMALWMAEEKRKGDASFYHPYFSMLPTEEAYKSFHPAYLEGWQLDKSLDIWEGTWLKQLAECHGGRESPTWEETKLAYVQVLTRQFDFAGLTPLADLPNTAGVPELTVGQYLNGEGDFCLKALRDLPAGTELLVDYGAAYHRPALMFILYGFALDSKYHNTTVPSDEEYQNAKYMLGPKDGCAGLRLPEFAPPPDAGPVLQNLARFAARFCRGHAEPREEL